MNRLMAIALMTALGASGVAHSEVLMEKVASGERSGIASARTVVIRDEAAWEALWNKAATRKPLPKVDFTKQMIVGIFLGTRRTSGFSVQVEELRTEQDILVVTYAEHHPSPRTMVMQVLTAPYCLVSVLLHAGSVRFEAVAASLPGPIH